MTTPKPGYRTSEFYVTATTIVGLVVAALAAPLPSKYAALGASLSGGFYAISRGLAKLFPTKPVATTVAPTTVAPAPVVK